MLSNEEKIAAIYDALLGKPKAQMHKETPEEEFERIAKEIRLNLIRRNLKRMAKKEGGKK